MGNTDLDVREKSLYSLTLTHWLTHILWYAKTVQTFFTRVSEIEQHKSYLQVVCYLKSDSRRLFSVYGVNVWWLCLALALVWPKLDCSWKASLHVLIVIYVSLHHRNVRLPRSHYWGDYILRLLPACCSGDINSSPSWRQQLHYIIFLQAWSRWNHYKKPEICIVFSIILHYWDGATLNRCAPIPCWIIHCQYNVKHIASLCINSNSTDLVVPVYSGFGNISIEPQLPWSGKTRVFRLQSNFKMWAKRNLYHGNKDINYFCKVCLFARITCLITNQVGK